MSDKFTTEESFDFEKAFNESFHDFQENSIITVKVVDISSDLVFLDFGYKSEAKLNLADFEKKPEIGDEFEVYLIRLEGRNGEPIVSKKQVDNINDKKELWNKLNKKELLEGTVTEVTRGGCVVKHKTVTGFIPYSLFDTARDINLDDYLNKKIKFYIERIDFRKGEEFVQTNTKRREKDFIGNRKRYIIEQGSALKRKIFEEKKEGDVVKGRVKTITDFGAFIDLGGMDALLRIKDISWARISNIETVLKKGQEIEVMILNINSSTKKITVGLKQLQKDPWHEFEENYNVNDTVTGTVVSIATYGAFVKIIDGVEGLLHSSDMSWTKKINNPSDLVKVGQDVELKIINIDKENRKISLSLKHLLENPWKNVESKYKIGTKVTGKVKKITTFGFFIELEEGIDALLHIDDISWTESIKNPHSLYNEGDTIEAVVIQCDIEKSKIKVGIKQLEDDPWKLIRENYKTGDIIKCTVDKIDQEKGLNVKITENVFSFIPISHIGVGRKMELKELLKSGFKVGDEISVIITNLDPRKRIIKLSIKEYLKKEEREKVENFLHDSKEDSKYTLGDAFNFKKNDE